MKNIIIVLIALSYALSSFAQDKIVKTDNTVIEGRVLKVDDTNIEINPVGSKPFLIVPRADAKMIIYEDNTVVSFEKAKKIDKPEEEERIRRQQEEERKRLEEERLRREQQADRLRQKGENTFGRQGVGDQKGSEGVTPGTGTNQGTTTGSPGATSYGDGSGLGDGPSYGLGHRKAVGKLPLPKTNNCNVTSRIVVNVEIQVDRNGNVVGASVKSATFVDNCIFNAVLTSARLTRFTSDHNASFRQTGWITYMLEP